MIRSTHTFVTLPIPQVMYDFLKQKLLDAGYHHAILDYRDDCAIDMHGIGLVVETEKELQFMIWGNLDNAKTNGHTFLNMHVDDVITDLQTYASDMENRTPDELRPHVQTWLTREATR